MAIALKTGTTRQTQIVSLVRRHFMNSKNIEQFSCQHCLHYRASTTRGEFCQLLFVPVHGELSGCSFYVQKIANVSTYLHAPYTRFSHPKQPHLPLARSLSQEG